MFVYNYYFQTCHQREDSQMSLEYALEMVTIFVPPPPPWKPKLFVPPHIHETKYILAPSMPGHTTVFA